MGKLLRNRFMIGILLSMTFLQLGIWVRNFAVLLFVMEKTNGSALAVSLISVAEFAPIFIFSFIGGVWADRWKPKKTMVWCDIGSAVSVAFVLLALLLGTWKAVFLATLVSSILSQFSQPSSMKLFKRHVPEDQLQTGMSMFQSVIAVFTLLECGTGDDVLLSVRHFGLYRSGFGLFPSIGCGLIFDASRH